MPKPFGKTLSRLGWDCGEYPLYCHESGALSKGKNLMFLLPGLDRGDGLLPSPALPVLPGAGETVGLPLCVSARGSPFLGFFPSAEMHSVSMPWSVSGITFWR